MNKVACIAGIAFLLCILGCAGKNTMKFNLAEVVGMRLDGSDVQELPRATLIGVEVAVPLPDCWAWHLEPGFATGHAAFLPSPRFFTGPSVCMGERWRMGGGVVYQLNPGYRGVPLHILGIGGGPSVAVTEQIILGWPIGISSNVHGGPLALAAQFRLMLVLYK